MTARSPDVARSLKLGAGGCSGGVSTGSSAEAVEAPGSAAAVMPLRVRRRISCRPAMGRTQKMRATCSGASANSRPSFRKTTGMVCRAEDRSSRRAISPSTREMPIGGYPASIIEVVTSTNTLGIPPSAL